ncbi:MAG: putative DNA-binding domain-containing protein [Burkholderiaceae bacterium]
MKHPAGRPMHSLAAQQSALLQTLFAKPGTLQTENTIYLIASQVTNTPARGINEVKNKGLQVYQANAEVLALRSLQASYPVVNQLIGDDAFSLLARDLWHHAPPTRGDVAQWGGGLAALINSIPQLAKEAYLPDVARIEWALHQAATAADASADLSSLTLLTLYDPDALTLQLAPGTAVLHSPHPAASVVTAHLYASPALDEVGIKLRAQTAESALVWRQGLRPMVALCPQADALFVQRLLAGGSLIAALEASSAASPTTSPTTSVPAFDFNTWLPQAARNGLLLGARLL